MPTPTMELEEVDIREGSFVDEGDNPEAHIVLVKARGRGREGKVAEKSLWNRMWDWVGPERPQSTEELLVGKSLEPSELVFDAVRKVYLDSVQTILEVEDDAAAAKALARSTKEYGERVEDLGLVNAQKHKDSVQAASKALEGESVDRAAFANALAAISQFQPEAPGAEEGQVPDGETTKDKPGESEGEADKASMRSLVMRVTDPSLRRQMLEEMEAMENKDGKTAGTEDKKNAPEAFDKAAPETPPETPDAPVDVSVKAALVEVQKQNKALAEKVAALEDEKATMHFRAKAKELAGESAGIDVNELGAVLKAAPEAERSKIEQIVSALVSQNEKARRVLTQTLGSTASGPVAGSAEDQLAQKAVEIRKQKPELSESEAYVKAMDQNPDLAMEAVRG